MPIPKIIPKGTTLEQWEQYEIERENFKLEMRKREPTNKFSKEWRDWHWEWSVNMPNEPGYFGANND